MYSFDRLPKSPFLSEVGMQACEELMTVSPKNKGASSLLTRIPQTCSYAVHLPQEVLEKEHVHNKV